MPTQISAPTPQRILEELRVRGPLTAAGLGTLLPFSDEYIRAALQALHLRQEVRFDPVSGRYDYAPQYGMAPRSAATAAATAAEPVDTHTTRRDHAAHAIAAALAATYPRDAHGKINLGDLAMAAYLAADALEKAR